jgi:hypothetical protein
MMDFDSALVYLYPLICASLLFEAISRPRRSLFETVISSYRHSLHPHLQSTLTGNPLTNSYRSSLHQKLDHLIQITEFSPTVLEVEENEKATGVFARAKWSSDRDVHGFAWILFEIIVGHPAMLSEAANAEQIPLEDIPEFVSEFIKLG